jgi:hypothetical protein
MSEPASELKEANLMTRSCWLAACAAALLLGGGAARAQSCAPAGSCCPPCPTADTARAPYYDELPKIIFPPHTAVCPGSGPAVWVRLFDAVARNCAPAGCGANAEGNALVRVRCEVSTHRTVSELLKLYRLFYQQGHYHAAETVARRALEIDPGNADADAALSVASVAADAVARARRMCGDAEDCESHEAGPKCGPCTKTSAGRCKGGCQAACKACAVKASCACGARCACAKDETCACGEDCCCKKANRHNVRHRRRVRQGVLHIFPNPVPMMMCPACPMCPGVEMALPHPGTALMPPPAPAMMPPQMMGPAGLGHPGTMMGSCCPCPVAQPERLPMPRVVSTPPVPGMVTTAPAESARGPLKIRVCGKQVHLSCPCLEARCDKVTSLPDGRALLEGDVLVTFHMDNRPAKILARRMIVDLEDGTYEVNPVQPQGLGIKPIRHEECAPACKVKKALVSKFLSALWDATCKPCSPAPCTPKPCDLVPNKHDFSDGCGCPPFHYEPQAP